MLIALYNADDDFHDRCVELWDQSRTHFLVSPLVVTEVSYFLARDRSPEVEASFLESFAAGHVVLAKPTERDMNRMARAGASVRPPDESRSRRGGRIHRRVGRAAADHGDRHGRPAALRSSARRTVQPSDCSPRG
ncbi:PIN domain-containing protein [Actinophytocola sp.]|uniref:PIN domain-containing protein n=1 Tax=Actinophytocola sp. TaxID=1872138 RepID=UPI003D6A49B0